MSYTSGIKLRRFFWAALLGTVVLKAVLAFWLPLTADEAYYILWGKYPSLVYYDHPGMVGWLNAFMIPLAIPYGFFRILPILFSTLIGIGIYRFLLRWGEEKAIWTALFFLVSPQGFLNVLVTADAPAIFFVFLGGLFLWRAEETQKPGYDFCAGLAAGAAFLSKYTSALFIGAALVRYLQMRSTRSRRPWLWFGAGLAPWLLFHGVSNYFHCGTNLLFNFRRVGAQEFTLRMPVSFWIQQVYLAMPWTIGALGLFFWRKESLADEESARFKFFATLFCVPLAGIFFLALRNWPGLHWGLAYYPFFFILAAILPAPTLKKLTAVTLVFTAVHLLFVFVFFRLDWTNAPWKRYQPDLVLTTFPKEVCEKVRSLAGREARLATANYGHSAILEVGCGERVSVFRSFSNYGREDDRLTRFDDLEGQDIATLLVEEPSLSDYVPYFDSVELRKTEIQRATYYLVLGHGFRYGPYCNQIQNQIADKFYPAAIPCFYKRCGQ